MTGVFDKSLRTHCMFLRQSRINSFDYVIKIVENNIPLGQDIGEEFHLL